MQPRTRADGKIQRMAWTESLPSGRYRACYRTADGRKKSVSGTFAHKKKALAKAVEAEEKSREPGWRDPAAGFRPWQEWCEEWWPTRSVAPGTLKRDEGRRDKHLMTRWADVALADITRQEIRAWASALRKSGLSDSSVQRNVHLLSASLSAAVDAEILSTNVAYRLKLPGGQTDERRYLTADECRVLLDQFAGFDRDLVMMLLRTGMRWGEAIGLQVQRVDLRRKSIRVAEVWDERTRTLKDYPKGRKIRDVPIPSTLRPAIKNRIGERATGYVFERNGKVPDYSNWHTIWSNAVKLSKLGHVRIHDLRHTYASLALQNGASLEEVGMLLGHVSTQTTRSYAHLAHEVPDHLKAALEW